MQDAIIEKFGMQNPLHVLENPDRPNIFYKVVKRPCPLNENNEEQFEKLISELASELKTMKKRFPVTIVYTSLNLCGIGYAVLDRLLGKEQYFPPGSPEAPCNRLFAQFHSPQSRDMKQEIFSEITKDNPTQRLLLVTIAFGMGIDPPSVKRVIHFGVPRKMEHYQQETGRAGRTGEPATASLFYNGNDIAKNIDGMDNIMRTFCVNPDSRCRREIILKHFGFSFTRC